MKLFLLGFTVAFNLLLIVIGAMFKIMHWPGAGILLTLGLIWIIPSTIFLVYYYRSEKNG